ncbi:hypothetical protein [Bowmanella dokdonensis]|uniref:Uncharacterized protein n=1 Tax=Bowmanella dokdonensis TaxID=751969 RepID=A0A939DSR3_9ALTE|nr:hypothetical protein [Bowmanella dokdonensis]MBN7827515.1 hypothetical protein [Bowmanella dokdonensis]
MSGKVKYIIGSGWWCDKPGTPISNTGRVLHGDDEIRSADFHQLWYKSICENSSPEKIVIVDSCSPVKPNLNEYDTRIEFIQLNENAGHSTRHKGKYCGWMRSVLVGLSYAMNSDCEYFVYVEQDVLMKGKGLIESEIQHMTSRCLFGRQKGLVQPLQQSMFIVKKNWIETFLCRLYSIRAADNRISPERKFAIASSRLLSLMPEFLFWQPKLNHIVGKLTHRLQTAVLKLFRAFGTLRMGYGRERPIEFSDKYFYFQHGSREELTQYLDLSNTKPTRFDESSDELS